MVRAAEARTGVRPWRRTDLLRARIEQHKSLLQHEEARLERAEEQVARAWPIRAIFRLDGGFGTGANVALLIEMGYDVYSKAANSQIVRAWLHETNPEAPAPFDQAQPSVKQMVRIATNTSAWVMWQPGGCLLKFTELSAFAGTELVVGDLVAVQQVLPVFKSCVFSPI